MHRAWTREAQLSSLVGSHSQVIPLALLFCNTDTIFPWRGTTSVTAMSAMSHPLESSYNDCNTSLSL